MSARPIYIFISLLYASAQLCLASGVIYTNVVQPVPVIGPESRLDSVYINDRYGLHIIDLSNNTVNPIMNYLWSVHDISDDQSSIIFRRPWAGVNSLYVALLKGESWKGNNGSGLVHRSPHDKKEYKRLYVTIDFLETYLNIYRNYSKTN